MFSLQERMSLKHQNKSKWAKAKAIMAKYDDSVSLFIFLYQNQNQNMLLMISIP